MWPYLLTARGFAASTGGRANPALVLPSGELTDAGVAPRRPVLVQVTTAVRSWGIDKRSVRLALDSGNREQPFLDSHHNGLMIEVSHRPGRGQQQRASHCDCCRRWLTEQPSPDHLFHRNLPSGSEHERLRSGYRRLMMARQSSIHT